MEKLKNPGASSSISDDPNCDLLHGRAIRHNKHSTEKKGRHFQRLGRPHFTVIDAGGRL